jgi:membrane-associated protease RseP (regulator of RpoE activity)
VADVGTQSEQLGIFAVLTFLIAVNIGFGIFNMLPMIPLDGGHVAIAGYEWIRTKKGKPYYRADINKLMPVATVFIAFLLVFVAASVYLDIVHPLHLAN